MKFLLLRLREIFGIFLYRVVLSVFVNIDTIIVICNIIVIAIMTCSCLFILISNILTYFLFFFSYKH